MARGRLEDQARRGLATVAADLQFCDLADEPAVRMMGAIEGVVEIGTVFGKTGVERGEDLTQILR